MQIYGKSSIPQTDHENNFSIFGKNLFVRPIFFIPSYHLPTYLHFDTKFHYLRTTEILLIVTRKFSTIVPDTLIIIPTYQEAENIRNLLTIIYSLPKEFHVLIIDDHSPDQTAVIVKSMRLEYPGKLFLIERPGKLGLGTAYITGFKWALEHQYEYVFEMDADFSHNPNDLIPLYNACHNDQADMAIGSRYIKGVAIVNWPIGRLLLSYYASHYVRMITRMDIRDSTAGFVCMSSRFLLKLNLDKIRMKGYGFQIEMKFKAWKLGFKIVEVPIIFINRELGSSKMSGGIMSEALMGVIRMKTSSLRANYNKHISN